MVMPVPAVCEMTFPLKVTAMLPPPIVTAVFAADCVMLPLFTFAPLPHVTVPLPRLTLNAGPPAAPVMEPRFVPHVPATEVRLTLPAVAVTLWNVPLTVPLLRLSAATPEMVVTSLPTVSVPNVLPLIAVVAPVMVRPLMVVVDVPMLESERPVVPPLIVPPAIVTLPLPMLSD